MWISAAHPAGRVAPSSKYRHVLIYETKRLPQCQSPGNRHLGGSGQPVARPGRWINVTSFNRLHNCGRHGAIDRTGRLARRDSYTGVATNMVGPPGADLPSVEITTPTGELQGVKFRREDWSMSREPNTDDPLVGAHWIWHSPNDTSVNQYICIRHSFTVEQESTMAELTLSVDSDYVAWLNGDLVGHGQFPDFPVDKNYDRLSAPRLAPGLNVLAILAYHEGEGTFSYRKGHAGLIYAIQTDNERILSGTDAFVRVCSSYRNGPVARTSRQIGFSFEYDAQHDDGWQQPNYVMSEEWRPSQTTTARNDERIDISPRPIQKLRSGEPTAATLKTQGVLLRHLPDDSSPAVHIQRDFLSSRPVAEIIPGSEVPLSLPTEPAWQVSPPSDEDGVFLLLDLGREECGHLRLDIDSDAGIIVDIGYGQHLDDLRVRASIADRNFAARYVTADGLQSFTHYFRRWSCRYIQLHILNRGKRFKLKYAGLIPAEYPVQNRGVLNGLDPLHHRIAEVARRTLTLCMHDHYEDTPWREQALYAFDSRNQALCGYYAFGEYDFPQASFALLGKSLRDDGFLELCAPAAIDITIPAFSFHWIAELAEHLMYSGRVASAAEALPIVRRILDRQIEQLTHDGLLPTPTEPQYWNFYDWSPGLAGSRRHHSSPVGRRDAPLNLLFVQALQSAALLERYAGRSDSEDRYAKVSQNVGHAIHVHFWDADEHAYLSYTGIEPHYAELTQSLAVVLNICPPNEANLLRRKLASPQSGWEPVTLSQSLVKFEALLTDATTFGPTVWNHVADNWGRQLFNGATSFWETLGGADDFANAGSLCHGWSAIPIYFYYAHLLGVRPTAPGFSSFLVEPAPFAVGRVGGVVPTPLGDITLDWEEQDNEWRPVITHPSGSQQEFGS